MSKQTDEDVDRNVVRIMNKEGKTGGTGFFIRVDGKEYCVTCHHNIYDLDEIYVGKLKSQMFRAGWVKEYSDIDKDIAILKVRGAPYRPLEHGISVYPRLKVMVMGFPKEGGEGHLSCDRRRGILSESKEGFFFKGEDIEANREYNTKPDVEMYDGYSIEPEAGGGDEGFVQGYSGSPVCYEYGLMVLGMFDAEQDMEKGYMIPITDILDKFKATMNTQEVIEKGNDCFSRQDYKNAVDEYYKVLDEPNRLADFALWDNSGRSLFELCEYQESAKCYVRATELKPNNRDSWYYRGLALDNLGW